MRRKWIWLGPLAVLGLLAFVALGGVIVQQLWNWLLPPLFGWRLITFWQAVAILALCRLLFGRWGGHSGVGSNVGRRMRHRMAERWEAMTPEERERFRQGMRGHCGAGPSPSGSQGQ